MKFIFCTLFAVLAVAAQTAEVSVHKFNGNRRVYDGKAASISKFPYQAGILFTPTDAVSPDTKFLGGGSLISSTRVLTAAHNVPGVSSALVILGAINVFKYEPGQLRIKVPLSGIVSHPNFNPNTLHNDIAMLKLPYAVKFNDNISPIALPEGSNNYVGVSGVISGWGEFDYTQKQSSFLRFANLKIITNSECNDEFGDIIDSVICVKGIGNVGACDGDSGNIFKYSSTG